MAENIENNDCSQRDNAEHEGYVKGRRLVTASYSIMLYFVQQIGIEICVILAVVLAKSMAADGCWFTSSGQQIRNIISPYGTGFFERQHIVF